jgi:lipopolysaccharide/colanic/teichoic acid biosynthesis glycosyltransferase
MTNRREAAARLLGRTASPWMPASVSVAPPESVREPRQPHRHPHVVAHELFRDAVSREQARADRFGQAFVLLLIEVDKVAQQPPSVWTSAIQALSVTLGETAILGWFETGRALGAIVPEICSFNPETLVRRELSRRLDGETIAYFSIRSHIYCPSATRPEERRPTEAVLFGQSSPGQSRSAHYGVKRALDVAASLTLLLLLSPILLLIAVLLKLTSPGPILFRQERVGRGAKPFAMLKFRSMRVNADPALHHAFVTKFIRSSAQLHPAGREALFKLTNDPRVTPLGRILRKTSLDELPQLWNVLRGDMSLVGPRPPLRYEVEQYQPWHWRRVRDAKPGITGLWQVNGRSRTTFDEMVRLDLRYVRTCSFWTDIKILLATPRAVISGKGAG